MGWGEHERGGVGWVGWCGQGVSPNDHPIPLRSFSLLFSRSDVGVALRRQLYLS